MCCEGPLVTLAQRVQKSLNYRLHFMWLAHYLSLMVTDIVPTIIS